jgi:hypothetical protein
MIDVRNNNLMYKSFTAKWGILRKLRELIILSYTLYIRHINIYRIY